MTIAISLLNNATGKPAVYFDRPDLSAFTLTVTTDSDAPVSVPSLRIRFPVKIIPLDQVKKIAVASTGWGPAAAAGPFVTLTPTSPATIAKANPLVIALSGIASTNNAATNDDVQVFVGGEAPAAKLFLMRYPAEAGDLTKALQAQFLPAEVYRTPTTSDRVQNVLILRLTNLNPSAPLVSKSWAGKPTVQLSFVYGNDIGSLTPADAPIGDPHSAFNIDVDVIATYKDGKGSYEWTSTPPESEATDTSPVWTLQPTSENVAVLGTGSGATAEFRLSGLSTAAPAGATLAYLQFTNFPGYSDCYIVLTLAKVEPEPDIVYFDGVPNYVAELGDQVTLEWQTFAMGQVVVQQDGQALDGPFDAGHGSFQTAIDRDTEFALLAYTKTGDSVPAHSAQWTAHVPHARGSFTADHPTVAAGSPLVLTWTTRFARAAKIDNQIGRPFSIPSAQLPGHTKTYFPQKPTTYTLTLIGEGNPPPLSVEIFVLPPDWSVRHMGFSPEAIEGPVLFGTDAGLTLVGGQSTNGIFQSPDGTDWEEAGIAQFPARNDSAGCVLGGKMWIMGGAVAGHPSRDVWNSDDGVTWTMVTQTAAWPGRSSFACAAFAGKLWVFGGLDQNLQTLGDVWSSSDGALWTQASLGTPSWSARSGAAVAVAGGKLWLYGGLQADGTVAADLWSSADGATWTAAATGNSANAPTGRQHAALISLDGTSLVLFGGVDATGAPQNDLNYFGTAWGMGTGPASWAISRGAFTIWQGALWSAGGASNHAASDAVWSWFPSASSLAAAAAAGAQSAGDAQSTGIEDEQQEGGMT